MNAVLIPSKITRLFAVVALSLISLHLITQVAPSLSGISTSNLAFSFLNEFPLEQNISVFYSVTALLFCFLVLFRTAEDTLDTEILIFICALTAYVTSELNGVRLIAPSRRELL